MISIGHYFHGHFVIGNTPIVIGPSVIISYSALITMPIVMQMYQRSIVCNKRYVSRNFCNILLEIAQGLAKLVVD